MRDYMRIESGLSRRVDTQGTSSLQYRLRRREITDIEKDLMGTEDIVTALGEFGISATDAEGKFRNLMYVLKDVQMKWKHSSNIADSARLSDLAQSIICALAAEKIARETSMANIEFGTIYNAEGTGEELDTFLSTFRVH